MAAAAFMLFKFIVNLNKLAWIYENGFFETLLKLTINEEVEWLDSLIAGNELYFNKISSSTNRMVSLTMCLEFLRCPGMSSSLVSFKSLLQLAILFELLDNVQTANQLAWDIELWIGWPFGVLFQALADFLVAQDVKGVVLDPWKSKKFTLTGHLFGG